MVVGTKEKEEVFKFHIKTKLRVLEELGVLSLALRRFVDGHIPLLEDHFEMRFEFILIHAHGGLFRHANVVEIK